MDSLVDPHTWAALLTLTVLEVVLGIDNIVFLSLLAGTLPEHRQGKARTWGLALAMLSRIALLLSITWVMGLETDFVRVFGRGVSGRDLILLAGGLFLLWKSTREIHSRVEGEADEVRPGGATSFAGVLVQIMALDVVLSLDSVITAVGMAEHLWIMVTAIVAAVGLMMLAAGPIGAFVNRHPSVKMLALAFLLLIGVTLVAEGFDFHIPKGYIYSAMAFSIFVEMLNLRASRRRRGRLDSSPVARP